MFDVSLQSGRRFLLVLLAHLVALSCPRRTEARAHGLLEVYAGSFTGRLSDVRTFIIPIRRRPGSEKSLEVDSAAESHRRLHWLGPAGTLTDVTDSDETQTGGAALERMAADVEAVLFASDSPLTPARIAEAADLPGKRPVKQVVEMLNRRYEQTGAAFRIEPIAGGYQMLTRPEFHQVVGRLGKQKAQARLSQATMETLAIVAYRQPILRADVEAIRGVACGEILRGLMDKHLVRIVGRAEVIGRPMLYGTTRRFLEVFGLAGIEDLPNVEELRCGARPAAPQAP